MSYPWSDLHYWQSGEWQVVHERLTDLNKARKPWNPGFKNLFAALKECSFDDCKVMILGQDPYPDSKYCTGLAFSIPEDEKTIPSSLRMIFDEYESDLHYPRPKGGSLTGWTKQGVLLWNVLPSCLAGQPLSHDWEEWNWLTGEIIDKLKEKGIVFVFLGGRARAYVPLVQDASNCKIIEASHPSPRASRQAHHPFVGSRIFTRINDALVQLGDEPINWRL